MLAEGILAEENLLFLYVGHHGIGPVEHGRFEKKDAPLAYLQHVARLHGPDVPARDVVEPLEALLASLRHMDRGPRRKPHDPVDACHMVVLDVVDNHVLYGPRVHYALDILDHEIGKVDT